MDDSTPDVAVRQALHFIAPGGPVLNQGNPRYAVYHKLLTY
jgi:hypothetical protein